MSYSAKVIGWLVWKVWFGSRQWSEHWLRCCMHSQLAVVTFCRCCASCMWECCFLR